MCNPFQLLTVHLDQLHAFAQNNLTATATGEPERNLMPLRLYWFGVSRCCFVNHFEKLLDINLMIDFDQMVEDWINVPPPRGFPGYAGWWSRFSCGDIYMFQQCNFLSVFLQFLYYSGNWSLLRESFFFSWKVTETHFGSLHFS